jgi:hypothetical protein
MKCAEHLVRLEAHDQQTVTVCHPTETFGPREGQRSDIADQLENRLAFAFVESEDQVAPSFEVGRQHDHL